MSSIIEHFTKLTDPRTKEHKKEHKLIDIVFITIAAVICGAEDWNDIEEYGKEKGLAKNHTGATFWYSITRHVQSGVFAY
jgi:hypothetical protein